VHIIVYILGIPLGIFLLLYGSELLVRHAINISRLLGISSFFTGITIVALGTSMPEVFASSIAAIKNEAVLTTMGLIGSNIFNIGAIFGLSCCIKPCKPQMHTSYYPIDVLAFFIASIIPFVVLYIISPYIIDSKEAVVILVLYGTYTAFQFKQHYQKGATYRLSNYQEKYYGQKLLHNIAFFLLSILLLAGGGEILIDTVRKIADRSNGPTQHILAVLIIACGTSLPELFVSINALIKKEITLSLGNIVGSTIFNTVFILPLAALLRNLVIQQSLHVDTLYLSILGLFIAYRLFKSTSISRVEGIILFTSFSTYIFYLFLS